MCMEGHVWRRNKDGARPSGRTGTHTRELSMETHMQGGEEEDAGHR